MNWARCTKRSGQGREAATCRICASLEAETGRSWSRLDIVYSRKKRDETTGSTLPPKKTPSQREDHLESGSPEQPQPMAETDADRFLNAFNETERHLQTVLQEDESISFKKLVREQGNRRVGPARPHEDELKNLTDLRNTIVHNPRRDGVAIAEPRREIVERMGELKSLIIDPPKVYPRFETNVTTARRDSPVRKIIQDMQQRNYSQAPILDDGNNVIGLLTANTIAR